MGGWGVSYPKFFWDFYILLNIYKAPKSYEMVKIYRYFICDIFLCSVNVIKRSIDRLSTQAQSSCFHTVHLLHIMLPKCK